MLILYTYLNVTHNRSVGEIDGRPLFDTLISLSNFERSSSNDLMDIRK